MYYSHGFAINWSDRTGVVPPKDIDVIMVAPKGSGTSLRTMFCEGRGLNCSYAVYQDASGKAEEKTIAFGIGIGAGYLFKTTFQREATSDLTGERGSLMGAIEGLLEAQYDVLRENGHSPSEAFNETVEELTQSLGPLFGEKGMDWMYANCSTTAQRGALDWAPRFREAIKPVMEWLYYSVKTGNEAQISIDKNSQADYREKLNAELEAMRNKEMWQAGVTVRKLRPEITNFFSYIMLEREWSARGRSLLLFISFCCLSFLLALQIDITAVYMYLVSDTSISKAFSNCWLGTCISLNSVMWCFF